MFHFQMAKQSICLLLENMDQLGNLNIDFVFLLILLFDIYSGWLFFKTRYSFSKKFCITLSWRKYNCFVSVIENVMAWAAILVATITQFSDQFKSRFISQSIKGISRVLQTWIRYLNGTNTSTFFGPLSSVWPVNFTLRLK